MDCSLQYPSRPPPPPSSRPRPPPLLPPSHKLHLSSILPDSLAPRPAKTRGRPASSKIFSSSGSATLPGSDASQSSYSTNPAHPDFNALLPPSPPSPSAPGQDPSADLSDAYHILWNHFGFIPNHPDLDLLDGYKLPVSPAFPSLPHAPSHAPPPSWDTRVRRPPSPSRRRRTQHSECLGDAFASSRPPCTPTARVPSSHTRVSPIFTRSNAFLCSRLFSFQLSSPHSPLSPSSVTNPSTQRNLPAFANHSRTSSSPPLPSLPLSLPNMAKKRRSLQAILVPSFLPQASSSSSPPLSASPSRQRSHTVTSPSDLNAIEYSPDWLSFYAGAASPGVSELSSLGPVTPSRHSPPPDLLDEDPFANLSPAPSVRGSRATSPVRSVFDVFGESLEPPRSPLAETAPVPSEDRPRILRHAASFTSFQAMSSASTSMSAHTPSTPPPTPTEPSKPLLRRPKSSGPPQVRPAWTRPAFKPRPSLPSLNTLARTSIHVPKVLSRFLGLISDVPSRRDMMLTAVMFWVTTNRFAEAAQAPTCRSSPGKTPRRPRRPSPSHQNRRSHPRRRHAASPARLSRGDGATSASRR
ncbi:hypothetical protein FKP32DRAFT_1236702 [Trametes sanguinea]|nr:hypothetical protein FKP32DRAFT_1236702 [Trametes sanguinea]